MAAIWTTPRTWVANEIPPAATWNTHLRNNLEWLKTPPFSSAQLNLGANVSTTSTSFVEMTSGFRTTITSTGGKILYLATFTVRGSAAGVNMYFDIGYRASGGGAFSRTYGFAVDGLAFVRYTNIGQDRAVTLHTWFTSLGAGTYDFTPMWKVSSGTATLWAASGTAGADATAIASAVELA